MNGGEGHLFRFRFGNDELGCIGDLSETRLELRISDEVRGAVQPLPLKVLAHLLRHANEFVSLDTLLREVWPAQGIERRAVYNAIDKLREALGRDGAAALVENARGGYRFKGTVYARIPESAPNARRADVRPGDTVPWRPGHHFDAKLPSGPGTEVWRIRPDDAAAGNTVPHVVKFCVDDERLLDLRKEVALALLLRDRLGPREDMARLVHWEFETPPFFVESVDGGQSLDTWAEGAGQLKDLPRDARLAMVLAIAEAVSAAHGVGVVHMDLKPSNILVAPAAGGWQVQVVDFGSGRSLDRAAIEKLGVQRLGLSVTQVVEGQGGSGTADYMAPEIRRGAELVVPVLCDVYALGVVLYQMLAGDLRKPLAPGWERDVDDPFLRDDIASATDGSPQDRLQSASALVQRLRELDARRARHRQDEADRAQALVDRERRRRYDARRPWVLSTLAVLLLGLGAAVVLWREAESARATAVAAAAQAEAVTRFLNEDVLGLADPYGGPLPSPAIRDALQRALARVDRAFAGQPRTEAAVRMALAGLLDKYDDPKGAEAQWRAVVGLLGQLDGVDARTTLQARYRAATAIARAGEFDQAEAWLAQADRDAARTGVNDPLTKVLANHAWGLHQLTRQRLDLAAAPFERALAISSEWPVADDQLLESIRHGLVTAYSGLGKFDASARIARDQLVALEKRPAAGELRIAAARYDLGQALLYQGDLAGAEPLLASANEVAASRLGAGSPSAVMMHTTRCELLVRHHRTEQALDCVLELHRALRASTAAPRWMAWLTLGNAGILQGELQRPADAVESLAQARQGMIDEHGPESSLQFVNVSLAQARWRAGQAAAALPLMNGLDPTALQSVEPDVAWPQRIALLRGLILASLGRRSEARALLAPTIEALESRPPAHPEPLLPEARALLPGLR